MAGRPRSGTERLPSRETPALNFFLGQMYAEGQRVPQDYVKAYAWLNLAAAQGIEAAAKTRTQIREKMTRAQVSEAQKLASDLFRRIESARSE